MLLGCGVERRPALRLALPGGTLKFHSYGWKFIGS